MRGHTTELNMTCNTFNCVEQLAPNSIAIHSYIYDRMNLIIYEWDRVET